MNIIDYLKNHDIDSTIKLISLLSNNTQLQKQATNILGISISDLKEKIETELIARMKLFYVKKENE